MPVEGSTWIVLGLILGVRSVQLLNSLFYSAYPEYIIARPKGANRFMPGARFLEVFGAFDTPGGKA